MKSDIDSFIEENIQIIWAGAFQRERLLTREEVEELLFNIPMEMVPFILDKPRMHRRSA